MVGHPRPLPQSTLEVFDLFWGLGEGNMAYLGLILIYNYVV